MIHQHRYSNVIGFDDAPFPRNHRGDVSIVGAVYAALRLDGVLVSRIRKDGANAAKKIVALIASSRFANHIGLIMLQGVAMAGFNVVDALYLHRRLKLPVLIVARHRPDMAAVRQALLNHVPGGVRKWKLIRTLGPMESVAGVYVQRVGLSINEAEAVIKTFAIHSHIPEPIRTAHLIAGAITLGHSKGRV
ncbi:DUF99 family protein [Desulfococcaceae bacterium HSG9]|nr:DUF99 family protein [Desulfococcaceae bacterium HSG9]